MIDLRALAAALAVTPAVVVSLRCVGFRRTKAWMARWSPPEGSPPRLTGERASARTRAIVRAVGVAAGRGPVRTSCLRRALLAWWLLRREGIPVTIRIGVRRDGVDLCAHAWIEHDGVPVGDDPSTVERYAAFDGDFAATEEAR